jgi:hypothetical protein
MKKCAVMQPSYLPWVGYFNLILNSDIFIFLDDVQYSKNTYFNRNRYPSKVGEGFSWLTVPIRNESAAQSINETRLIDDGKWQQKHLKTLAQNYSRADFFSAFFPTLQAEIGSSGKASLATLNIGLIRAICSYLNIKREFFTSSELNISGPRSERLLAFCEKFDCEVYLSPAGAREYIEADAILGPSTVKVQYQNYICQPYKQRGFGDFIPYMSIVDLLFRFDRDTILKNIFQAI